MNVIEVPCKHPVRLKLSSSQECWTTCSEAKEQWCPGFMKEVQTQTSMVLFTWHQSKSQTGMKCLHGTQPSLRIHFTCVYYPPVWNASMPLIYCVCSKQISQTRFNWTQFMFTWFPSLILDRCESFASVQQWSSVKPTWDDNYFILASHFIPPSCKQKQALVWSWSEVVPA